ncbi:cytochrome P450 [Streptomyces liangshanensis]|uniref:Cytochrome P450 n=1 Tax=Streptomyces liangshanensis TaxID=2717324 RepID=A0A6G9H7Y7_9ACTN|nr:cytochrome P450 [Streptomyces liangshanensis]QIQ06668.1 cytochrome P450 [Streptomyces liangshanensis]
MSPPEYGPPDLPGLDFDPFLAHALEQGPPMKILLPQGEELKECWLVTRYDEVRFVTSDPRFSRRITGRPFPTMNRHLIPMGASVSFIDPPDHTRIRSVVTPAFSEARMKALRPRVETLVAELLDGLEAAGPPTDLIEAVVSPLPLTLVGEIFGFPPADRPRIRSWAEGILVRPRDEADAARARALRDEAAGYFRDLIERRRAAPADDLMSDVARAVDEERVTGEEALAMASLTALNGWHPVRNNLANMVFALLRRPHLVEALRAGDLSVPLLVEELLRWIPHKNGIGQPRVAVEDVAVGEVTVRAGDVVYVQYWAANRDPGVFACPAEIDAHRPGPNHLAFGHGPHYCVAPHLARVQAHVLLPALFTRFPGLRLAVPPEEVEFQKDALIRGPVTLPVAW